MAKSWEDLSAQGMKFFNLGQDDLLHFRHVKAKENFAISASNFAKASSAAKGSKKSEMMWNAAVSAFHGGNYTRAHEYLSATGYHKGVPGHLKDNYLELATLIKSRKQDSYWDSMRADIYNLKREEKWDAILDMIRDVPYAMTESECKRYAAEACLKLGHKDVAKSIIEN